MTETQIPQRDTTLETIHALIKHSTEMIDEKLNTFTPEELTVEAHSFHGNLYSQRVLARTQTGFASAIEVEDPYLANKYFDARKNAKETLARVAAASWYPEMDS